MLQYRGFPDFGLSVGPAGQAVVTRADGGERNGQVLRNGLPDGMCRLSRMDAQGVVNLQGR